MLFPFFVVGCGFFLFGFRDKKQINQNASPPRTREYWDKIYESKKEKKIKKLVEGGREKTRISHCLTTHTKS